MTKLSVLFWQNIPSVVEARDTNGIEKVELSKRFNELIDLIAMKKGLAGTDDYLNNWEKKKLLTTEKTAKEIVMEISKDFESQYEDIKFKALKSLD
tara:strand:+ start:458 stop:745 length:288 start_codon:yes stop_codon:yes gene_type:complete